MFKCFHWNILSTTFTTPSAFPIVEKKVLKQCQNWSWKCALIVRTILEFNPDFAGLVEVDHNHVLDLLIKLPRFNFLYYPKSSQHHYGILLLYRKNLHLIRHIPLVHENKVFGILGVWIHPITHNYITVGEVHLKAKPEFERVRYEQIYQIMQGMSKIIHLPFILMGDFNDTPDSTVIKKCRSTWANVPFEGYTTFKIREEQVIQRMIDYIWFANGYISEFYNPPQDLDLPGLPNLQIPSDHLPLYAEFSPL